MWLDEMLLHATNFVELFNAYERLLKQSIEEEVRFNVKKCTFMTENLEGCGVEIENSKLYLLNKYYAKHLKAPRSKCASE